MWGPHKYSIPQIVFDSVGHVRFRDAREDFYKGSPSVENALRGRGAMGDRDLAKWYRDMGPHYHGIINYLLRRHMQERLRKLAEPKARRA